MTKKIKCALIGPGNIGTDLLAKLQRSAVLEPVYDFLRFGLERQVLPCIDAPSL